MDAANTSMCAMVRSHVSACGKVSSTYGVTSPGMTDRPAWATLLLAACIMCGEAKYDPTRGRSHDPRGRSHDPRGRSHGSMFPFNFFNTNNINNEGSKHFVKDNNTTTTPTTTTTTTTTTSIPTTTTQDPLAFYGLAVGRSMNLLPRYGFLTLSLKVFPHRTDNEWIFRENTGEIFQKSSYWAQRTSRRSSTKGKYDEHFLIDFCDSVGELLIAYFDHFHIEGIPNAHKAFTSSLSSKTKAAHLGINSHFLDGSFSFVLIRLFRRKRRDVLDGVLTPSGNFKEGMEGIRVSSYLSAHQFMDNFGTHVITEYEVGDVMYQVYVFGPRTYLQLKNNFALSKSTNELSSLEQFFSPHFAIHVGKVKIASGNPEFETTVAEKLKKTNFFTRFYQSIFQIFKHQELEEELERLDGDVVLSLKLKKITAVMPKGPERHWLSEVLDNTLSLYYVTM